MNLDLELQEKLFPVFLFFLRLLLLFPPPSLHLHIQPKMRRGLKLFVLEHCPLGSHFTYTNKVTDCNETSSQSSVDAIDAELQTAELLKLLIL